MKHPKYSYGDVLWYVNPFVFTIEQIQVRLIDPDETGRIYYIDDEGAYLLESDLVETVEEAVEKSLFYLERFVKLKKHEINNVKKYYEGFGGQD